MIEKLYPAFERQQMAKEKAGEECKEQNRPSLVPSSLSVIKGAGLYASQSCDLSSNTTVAQTPECGKGISKKEELWFWGDGAEG
jgi:hypothetical protein